MIQSCFRFSKEEGAKGPRKPSGVAYVQQERDDESDDDDDDDEEEEDEGPGEISYEEAKKRALEVRPKQTGTPVLDGLALK